MSEPDGNVELVAGQSGRVLAVLLSRIGQAVDGDTLVEALWGEHAPAEPRNALQVTINRLRRRLEPGRRNGWKLLVTDLRGYRLASPASDLDSTEYRALVTEARTSRQQGRVAEALATYRKADELWRGSAYAGLEDCELLRGEMVALEELRHEVREETMDLRLDLGQQVELVTELPQYIDEAPYREHRWAQLMLAFYRTDRQADALRTYRRLQDLLGEELGIEPCTELKHLEERILLQDPVLHEPSMARQSLDLPEIPTRFIGRDEDARQVRKLFDRHRLVTLAGIGGIGKTRLALAAGAEIGSRFRDGLTYVDLTQVVEPSHLVVAVAGAAQPNPRPSQIVDGPGLVEFLRGRQSLLMIDNAEHLLESVRTLVAELITACPQLRVLCTSRVPLQINGEVVFPVTPLALPPSDVLEPAELARYESVLLFLDRAGGLELSTANASDVSTLCHLLGGVPLGLELAATLLGTFGLAELRTQVEADTSFVDAAPLAQQPGHRFTDAVGWSVDLLDELQRSVFGALSAFRGGWTLEAAEAVGQAAGAERVAIAPILARLVERCLIRFSADPYPRYHMIEPLRRAAADGLDEEERTVIGAAHRQFFRRLMIATQPEFEVVGSSDLYGRMELEMPNLRVMLETGISQGEASILDAFPSLALLWSRRTGLREGAQWFDRALAAFKPAPDSHPLVYLYGAHLAMWSGDPELADDRLVEFEGAAARLGEPVLLLRAHHTRGNLIGWGRGQPQPAIPHFRAALATALEAGLPRGLPSALSAAYMAVRVGDYGLAEEVLSDLTSFAQWMPQFADMGADQVQGLIDLYQGRLEPAIRRLANSVEICKSLGLNALAGPLLIPLGWALYWHGQRAQSHDVALEAYRFVHEHNGGWRAAEPMCLLGALAFADGEGEAAGRWFLRGLVSAAKAPEADLVIWSIAGLSAYAQQSGRLTAGEHLATHLGEMTRRHHLIFPQTMVEEWGLSTKPEAMCSLIGAGREIGHLVGVAKEATGSTWSDLE